MSLKTKTLVGIRLRVELLERATSARGEDRVLSVTEIDDPKVGEPIRCRPPSGNVRRNGGALTLRVTKVRGPMTALRPILVATVRTRGQK